MTHYIQYKSQSLTCHWRGKTTLDVRLSKHCATRSLLVHMGDTLLITNKRGVPAWSCKAAVFTPRMHYGGFTRSGVVQCVDIADLREDRV